jgi:site-specific DNA-methyltransferase (adenine-specific)
MWEQLNRIIKPNGAICLFGSEPFSSALRMSNINHFKYDWIWEKTRNSNPLLAKKQPLRHHEIISVFYKKQCTYNPQMEDGKKYVVSEKAGGRMAQDEKVGNKLGKYIGGEKRYPRSVLKFSNSSSEAGFHPTQKPIALLEYLIKTYTNPGETVLDFTMGSGSTGAACVNTGRKFIGIELDEGYFNIAKKRIEEAYAD